MVDVVLVHGAWSGAWAWDDWVAPLAAAGHAVHVLDLPGHGDHEVPPSNSLSLRDYVDAVQDLVGGLSAAPVVVGHSMGGAVTQLLLSRDDAPTLAGVVLLASVPLTWRLRREPGL